MITFKLVYLLVSALNCTIFCRHHEENRHCIKGWKGYVSIFDILKEATKGYTSHVPKFSNRQAWANSVDPDQTAPDQGLYTVCNSVCIFWSHYSIVEPQCSNFKIITAPLFRVSEYLGILRYKRYTKTHNVVTVIFWRESRDEGGWGCGGQVLLSKVECL